MLEALLIVIAVMLWFVINPKKDWYIVEVRSCDSEWCNEVLIGINFITDVANKERMYKDKIWEECNKDNWLLKESSGSVMVFVRGDVSIVVRQTVFDNITAANINFESEKQHAPYGYAKYKIYMWQTTSRFKRKVNLATRGLDLTLMASFPEKGSISTFPNDEVFKHSEE